MKYIELFAGLDGSPIARDLLRYPPWTTEPRAPGYALSANIVDAADYGVPQNRKRLIIVGTRSRHPVVVPKRSVSQPTIGPAIQWDQGPWRKIDNTLAPTTRRRIKNGRRVFGDRFLTPYYSNGSGLTGRSLERPIGTITTRAHWAIVDGNQMRMLNVEECRAAMGFPSTYKLPGQSGLAKHMLGNAVPPPMVTGILEKLRLETWWRKAAEERQMNVNA
jgi:DNA (cytosine-5)-methyltransferase 1